MSVIPSDQSPEGRTPKPNPDNSAVVDFVPKVNTIETGPVTDFVPKENPFGTPQVTDFIPKIQTIESTPISVNGNPVQPLAIRETVEPNPLPVWAIVAGVATFLYLLTKGR